MFMLWQHGEKELKKFLQFQNCYHSTIKFTAIYSHKEINFLDVSVRIKKNNFRPVIKENTACVVAAHQNVLLLWRVIPNDL